MEGLPIKTNKRLRKTRNRLPTEHSQSIHKTKSEAPPLVNLKDFSISALLGASPGASVSANVILNIIKRCFPEKLASEEGRKNMQAMIPSYDEDLSQPEMASRQQALSEQAFASLDCL